MARANRLVLLVFGVLSLAAFAAAQSYTVTDLGPGYAFAINSLGDVVVWNNGNSFVWTPGGSILTLAPLPGDNFTRPGGINGQGLAVGESENTSDKVYSAVLWTNGAPLNLGTLPGGTRSVATDINASGEVVGYGSTTTGQEAFLWTKATGMQGLGNLGGNSFAGAINRFGKVVGLSGAKGNRFFYAFFWSKTTGMTNLGNLPGYDDSSAYAINDLGQVAGGSDCLHCTLRQHATLWGKTKGSMLDLGVLPGALDSLAYGLNNVGQVVGGSDTTNYTHAFFWSPSTGMLDLNNLIPANSGWVLEGAFAINDSGQIVGQGTFNGSSTEAFLLTPQ